MKKLTSKPFKKRKKAHRKSQPRDICRTWTLATRLEHRRIKSKKK